jgi:hypothetical protein
MSTIGSYLPSLLNSARDGYATTRSQQGHASQPSLVQTLDDQAGGSGSSSPTTVTLSDAAKSYLAGISDQQPASLGKVAADARAWFDQSYKSLGISSAMLDGKVAVDLTGQSRAALSAVASNADGFFSGDERTAAATELGMRFGGAMASYVVVARHTGDYAGLYRAASDYLDGAGADEQATDSWKAQKQAVMAGLSAAKASFGRAPDTGNADDPVRALLDTPVASAEGALGANATTAQVATRARALLDNQANAARDSGTELVFDKSRGSGRLVDLSGFDNRTLATIALNQGSSFSSDEARAAKNELHQRTRSAMSDALFPSSNDGKTLTGALGLMQTYKNMSDEEKAVLGVTEETTARIMRSYKTQQSVKNTLAAYL